jgi:hypothetical protein
MGYFAYKRSIPVIGRVHRTTWGVAKLIDGNAVFVDKLEDEADANGIDE